MSGFTGGRSGLVPAASGLAASGTGSIPRPPCGLGRGLKVGAEPLQLPGVGVTQEQQLLFPFFCMS